METPLKISFQGGDGYLFFATPELALAAIESVSVLGAFHASPAVRKALVSRMV